MSSATEGPLSPGAHTVELEGIRQSYHVAGTGPVCLAHPGGPGFTWNYLRAPLLEEHLTMVYVEPIGTGGSGRLPNHPDGYTRERYSAALLNLVDHLGLPKVHLLGHSHGSFVAQLFAMHHADRLAGIILYEGSPEASAEFFGEAMRNVAEFARVHADNPALQDVLDAWQAVPTIGDDATFTDIGRRILPLYFADYWGREAEFGPLAEAVGGSHISGLDDQGVPTGFDDHDQLGSIDVPTLVLVGRHDFICGPRWAQQLADGIPGARQVVLENSGHFGHLEEPQAFAQAITDFVTTTPAT